MYDGYHALAAAYDRLNAEVDYEKWSIFIHTCFQKYLPAKPEIVLDLACGTGRMTFPLLEMGYDMIGIDGSEDMLLVTESGVMIRTAVDSVRTTGRATQGVIVMRFKEEGDRVIAMALTEKEEAETEGEDENKGE